MTKTSSFYLFRHDSVCNFGIMSSFVMEFPQSCSVNHRNGFIKYKGTE